MSERSAFLSRSDGDLMCADFRTLDRFLIICHAFVSTTLYMNYKANLDIGVFRYICRARRITTSREEGR